MELIDGLIIVSAIAVLVWLLATPVSRAFFAAKMAYHQRLINGNNKEKGDKDNGKANR